MYIIRHYKLISSDGRMVSATCPPIFSGDHCPVVWISVVQITATDWTVCSPLQSVFIIVFISKPYVHSQTMAQPCLRSWLFLFIIFVTGERYLLNQWGNAQKFLKRSTEKVRDTRSTIGWYTGVRRLLGGGVIIWDSRMGKDMYAQSCAHQVYTAEDCTDLQKQNYQPTSSSWRKWSINWVGAKIVSPRHCFRT